jgi:hypothetical protein
MQIVREIKLNRLLWAIGLTILIADTVPHPGLAPGVLQGVIDQLADRPAVVPEDYLSAQ